MSIDVATARSGQGVGQHRLTEQFMALVLDDPDLLDAEFASIVDGLDSDSASDGDAGPSGRSADSGWAPDDADDAPASAGGVPIGRATRSARPPPRTR